MHTLMWQRMEKGSVFVKAQILKPRDYELPVQNVYCMCIRREMWPIRNNNF